MTEAHRQRPLTEVSIEAPARLHMGFLDPSGSLGRTFGSIGVGLREIVTAITLRPAAQLSLPPEHTERCASVVRSVSAALGFPVTAEITIGSAIPEHVGLGSGTQFALALGLGLHRLYGLEPSIREVARLIGRGRRSGVGIATFEQGGFIVDGGHGEETLTPPLLSRLPFPDAWRFVLVFDQRGGGLHGAAELAAFEALPPFPEAEAARLCHRVLLRALPAVCEQDLATFGAVIDEVQGAIGDYFSPAQGGRFTSTEVADALAWLATKGAVALGQTSWGPTGFCLTATPEQAERLAALARDHFRGHPDLAFIVASARNEGARIDVGRVVPTERTATPDQPAPETGHAHTPLRSGLS